MLGFYIWGWTSHSNWLAAAKKQRRNSWNGRRDTIIILIMILLKIIGPTLLKTSQQKNNDLWVYTGVNVKERETKKETQNKEYWITMSCKVNYVISRLCWQSSLFIYLQNFITIVSTQLERQDIKIQTQDGDTLLSIFWTSPVQHQHKYKDYFNHLSHFSTSVNLVEGWLIGL